MVMPKINGPCSSTLVLLFHFVTFSVLTEGVSKISQVALYFGMAMAMLLCFGCTDVGTSVQIDNSGISGNLKSVSFISWRATHRNVTSFYIKELAAPRQKEALCAGFACCIKKRMSRGKDTLAPICIDSLLLSQVLVKSTSLAI